MLVPMRPSPIMPNSMWHSFLLRAEASVLQRCQMHPRSCGISKVYSLPARRFYASQMKRTIRKVSINRQGLDNYLIQNEEPAVVLSSIDRTPRRIGMDDTVVALLSQGRIGG